jgi:hypothetical protein
MPSPKRLFDQEQGLSVFETGVAAP